MSSRLNDFASGQVLKALTLRFRYQRRDEFCSVHIFPSELLRAAGSLGLSVELSVYETPAGRPAPNEALQRTRLPQFILPGINT